MIKRVTCYFLPEGTDPDEFWKYHREVHAPDVTKALGPKLKKYVIHRIDRVVVGETNLYGFTETWWDTEKDAEEAYDAMRTEFNDFHSRVTGFCQVLVDERQIVP